MSDFDLVLLSLNDYSISEVAPEDGNNELENAASKAKFYCKKTGEVCLSDDAGLYIPALGNMPGVQVRRWAGELPNEIDDQAWLEFFQKKISHLTLAERQGSFKIARVVVCPDHRRYEQKWEREFRFNDKPNMEFYLPGWPLSTMVIENNFHKPWSALTLDERLSYEKENIKQFGKFFQDIFK